ncbi:hypothetical protein AV540_09655 [Brevibacillus parabrevis]|uniref:YcdB/YcdC domain-containing protein n=1 Tax=Brevibacillus parabrevis TaxID=54914 RepID=UPI0007ABA961|nr:YcdB/YcdC domain-containing protein [Brevibacillus parabrevis]KZE52869.1 hypothetical protein AV540_09655 [Brevibacillus parabrevis]
MELDQGLREAVREAGKAAASEVKFTREMEERIRMEVGKKKQKNRNRMFMVGSIAACLAVTAWGVQEGGMLPLSPQGSEVSVATANNTKKTTGNEISPEQALAPLKKAVPELGSITLRKAETLDGITLVTLLQKDRAIGQVAYDTQTGRIESYLLDASNDGEKTTIAPAEAETVAQAFLLTALGEEARAYEHQATEVYSDEDWRHGTWMNVSYRRLENGKPVPFDVLTVQVDKKERVAFFGRLNQQEQKLFAKFAAAVPELNLSPVVYNKELTKDGWALVLGKVNDEGKTAMVSEIGNGQDIDLYRIQRDRNEEAQEPNQAEALQQAKQFLGRLLGADSENYRHVESNSAEKFMRYHSGLPVMNDVLDIEMGSSGSLLMFSKPTRTYSPSSFPDASEAVAKSVAENELAANMKLVYVQHMSEGNALKQPTLEYRAAVSFFQQGRPFFLDWYIDAHSGKINYGTGNNGFAYDQLQREQPQADAFETHEQPVTVRTKEEAKALLQTEFGVNVEGMSYRESVDDHQKNKSFNWTDSKDRWHEVTIDAKTSQVVGLRVPRTDTQVTVKREQAEQAAVFFLDKYADWGVKEVQLVQVMEPGEANPVSSGNWVFRYVMSKDGIPVLDKGPDAAYEVSVDPATGKVNSFRNWRETHKLIELPSSAEVVSKQKAAESFLRVMPLKLVYLLKDQENEWLDRPRLAYIPWSEEALASNFITIDAKSGEVVIEP